MLKRTFDFIFSLCVLLALSPVFALIAIWIWQEDKCSPLFVQNRVGRQGKEFKCLKFRTMHAGSEAQLRKWEEENHELWQEYVACNFKLKNDPRITAIGRLLRKTSLDELPQFLNILLGDMSVVGPRPLLARELPDYGQPAFSHYQRLRPGITGLWQVSGRSQTSFARRAELDVEYSEQRSFFYDLRIVFKTVHVMIKKDGAF